MHYASNYKDEISIFHCGKKNLNCEALWIGTVSKEYFASIFRMSEAE
jgi:hypothetical protein